MTFKCPLITLHQDTLRWLLCVNQDGIFSCHVVSKATSNSLLSPSYSDFSSIIRLTMLPENGIGQKNSLECQPAIWHE